MIKHALQCYVKRENASENDIQQEKILLDKVTDEVTIMKEKYGID